MTVLAAFVAILVLACTGTADDEELGDADAGGADPTASAQDCRQPRMDAGCASGGDTRDAMTLDAAGADGTDASPGGAADARVDAGPACDPAACPIPSAQTLALLPRAVRACCTEDGRCGLEDSEYLEPGDCIALEEGMPDDDCYEHEADADGGAGMLEGCCRTDGVCGHVDPQVGCHEAVSRTWAWELRSCRDGDDPPPPEARNPFRCTPMYEACSDDWECCQDPASNYITLCGGGEYSGPLDVVCEPDV